MNFNVNGYLYLISGEKFRRDARKLFGCWNDDQSDSSTNSHVSSQGVTAVTSTGM